jgi:hypothetical protein
MGNRTSRRIKKITFIEHNRFATVCFKKASYKIRLYDDYGGIYKSIVMRFIDLNNNEKNARKTTDVIIDNSTPSDITICFNEKTNESLEIYYFSKRLKRTRPRVSTHKTYDGVWIKFYKGRDVIIQLARLRSWRTRQVGKIDF